MKRFACVLFAAVACLSANAAPGVYTVLTSSGLVSMPSGNVIATTGAIGTSGYDLAADSGFNYYVAGVGSIKKVTPAGVVTTLATAGLNSQWISDAVDATGNVIVADNEQHMIYRISPGGVVTQVGNYPICANNLEDSTVRVDAAGNYIIVSDNCSPSNVYRMTPAGQVTIVPLSPPIISNVSGMTIDPNGNYIISAYGVNTIYSVTPAGAVTAIATSSTQLNHNPYCIAYDPGAQYFVVCAGGGGNNSLLSVTRAGVISSIFTSASLAGARGVIVTTPGTVPVIQPVVPVVPTTPAPTSLLLMLTSLLAVSGFLYWKRRVS